MKSLTILAVFSALFLVTNCDLLIAGSDPSESESEFETSQEFLDAVRSNSLNEFKLNNETKPLGPTNVTLSMTNRTLKCSIQNLVPNNGYVVTFFRNDIAFGFYRVRAYDVIWSTMNLNTILDFYPAKGALGAYPNFTVDISADSKLYGDYQCSVKLLGIQNDGDDIMYNSNRIIIVKEKAMTPKMKWQKVFPAVNVTFALDSTVYDADAIYEAKCKVRFDRPVSEYIVYFMAGSKAIGAYMVQTDPAKIKWQLFARNLLESKHLILELEDESGYPNYVLLIKLNGYENLSCKVEIPSKKHPITYHSNIAEVRVRISNIPVRIEAIDSYNGRCIIEFPENAGTYELSIVDTTSNTHRSLGRKNTGGTFRFDQRNANHNIKCRVTYYGRTFDSGNI